MSFKFEPGTETNTATVLPNASSITGLQDIVRDGPSKSVNDAFTQGHPLESRLGNWESSQLGMKLHMQRQIYGLHAPLRTMMEIQSIQKNPALLGSRASRIQLDILLGKDDTIDISDVFGNNGLEADTPDIHRMLAKKLNL
ncbi:hypothetical protein IW140_000848 [Coemansia sp. RSA 1813]|nr:hypothetical protein EV178_001432 [Coemansia sp. RSA 1646]KAJ1771784.1 hypothetical protein LPJ74_002087 [Coemansia sp. RSA 1843]KAJ2093391.1 hypothetical protein IW138_000241 [Coemansia sp. RSA 986]KAJ2217199.1 hypothetical protein EV179_000666 [Coemansia sp. RSA 487]KAJ2572397.1 hypothetical protein IW140_000848 [Coemansia sp. RSA 1813]